MAFFSGHHFMPLRSFAPLTPERASAILDEALRRVGAHVSGPVDLDVLRQALETEQAKGPRSLAALVKVGRRRALDRIARVDRKAAGRR